MEAIPHENVCTTHVLLVHPTSFFFLRIRETPYFSNFRMLAFKCELLAPNFRYTIKCGFRCKMKAIPHENVCTTHVLLVHPTSFFFLRIQETPYFSNFRMLAFKCELLAPNFRYTIKCGFRCKMKAIPHENVCTTHVLLVHPTSFFFLRIQETPYFSNFRMLAFKCKLLAQNICIMV